MREQDEFFVGYLPTPPGIKRFAGRVSTGLIMLLVAAALLIATSQRDPGTGVWTDNQVITLDGMALAWPYAMLRTIDDRGRVRTLLIVEEGKHGADRLLPHANHFVRLSGTLLQRGERMMLELVTGDHAIQPLPAPPNELLQIKQIPAQNLGIATLPGRIVDPKCFLGAMKPGEGKPHKACASLCIRGGIPPIYLAADSKGEPALYLLTDAQGRAVGPALLEYVSDAVNIAGRIERVADLLIFRIDPTTISRR